MALRVGDRAPDFTLRDGQGKSVSLSEFRGRNVVVAFYRLAFTSG